MNSSRRKVSDLIIGDDVIGSGVSDPALLNKAMKWFREEKIMPDITMCRGGDCPLKKKCYRFLVPPTPFWQSYFSKIPYDKTKKTCEHFVTSTSISF